MKKQPILPVLIGVLLVLVSIPAIYLLKTNLSKNNGNTPPPSHFANDASGLSLTRVDTIITVAETKIELIPQLQTVLRYAKAAHKPVSIAGAKHTMGGHTLYPDGIVLNMRPFREMHLDTVTNVLTIGSGALWEEAIRYLDPFNRSIAVMQAFSSFSIGGSLSVNGHGWQKNSPPLSSSVVSFTLMDHNGEVLTCSRTENQELFSLVMGGYGLFGIILEVKLRVVPNENLDFALYKFKSADYLTWFKTYASGNQDVKLVFGRLNISQKEFLEHATLNVFASDKRPLPPKPMQSDPAFTEIKRLIFRNSVNSEFGKRLRWDLETGIGEFSGKGTFSRNELLNDSVSLIENKDSASTDILQEYFIPERHFNAYIAELKKILPNQTIDLLNITIRDVYRDTDSYLNYARENVFGFVFLFNQKKNASDESEMKKLTKRLVELAIKMEGTYYLPYRLHIDRDTFRIVYPQADAFFKLKLKYDPDELFRNKFYDHYR